jgi:hypothetical protein
VILAQIGLGINFFAVMIGLVIVLITAAALITTIVLIIVALVRRRAGNAAFLAGAVSCFLFGAALIARLWGGASAPTFILAMFFATSAAGLLLMLIALRTSFGILRTAFVAIGISLVALSFSRWFAMERRDQLSQAVLREDVAAVRTLLGKGAGRHSDDGPFRQAMIVHAARDANPDLVAAFLEAGADPNAPDQDRTPLIGAITADPVLRLHEIDRSTHRRNQMRTTILLLDHGADPNRPAKPGEPTPAELAWSANDQEMLALLEKNGAKDARKVGADFEELMNAAATGDLKRVETVESAYGGRLREDATHRSPLIAAAGAGHLAVVDSLLKSFRGLVKCTVVDEARDTAARQNHPEVVARLRGVC